MYEMYDREKSIREIREAMEAGKRAQRALEAARSCLKTAGGWGVWDMIGGGLFSGLLKHSSMDKAQRYVEDAVREMRAFQKELDDVSGAEEFHITLDGFSKAADLFLDNIVVDYLVQSRIRESQKQLEQLSIRVERIMETLRKQLEYETGKLGY